VTPLNKKLLLAFAIALLVAAGYALWASASARDAGSGNGSTLELPDGDSGGGVPQTGDDGASSEVSRTPGSSIPALESDNVPDEAAYEIIDALRNADITPVMGSDLTLVYVERLDTVRVTGRFENSTTTSYVLTYEDGTWKVKE